MTIDQLIAANPAASEAEIADLANAMTVTQPKVRFINKVSIYSAVGFAAGLQIVGALNAMAASADPGTSLQGKELLLLLDPRAAGIDISLDESQAVVDQLVSAGALTAENAEKIKSLGSETIPWPIANGYGRFLDHADIAAART